MDGAGGIGKLGEVLEKNNKRNPLMLPNQKVPGHQILNIIQ